MATAREKITPKQELLIAALLSHSTIQTAAAAAGVSETTAHRWLRTDPVFADAYRAARCEAVRQAVSRLQSMSSGAAAVLGQIASDVKAPASARVTAAVKIIELAQQGIQLDDLAARIERLEQGLTS